MDCVRLHEPQAQPIAMETARDSVYDLPDHIWRTRPTTEPGGLTVPQSELLVHPNTEVHATDVDDDENPPRPAVKPRAPDLGDGRKLTPSRLRKHRKLRPEAKSSGYPTTAEAHSSRVFNHFKSSAKARSWRRA